jgi:hypothetical protein
MHLLRLLLTGAATLREGRVPVRVEAHRDCLLAAKRGEAPWTDCPSPIGWERVPQAGEGGGFAWRQELHREFERALAETKLPERPDYEAANRFLVKARREMTNGTSPCC